MANRRLIPLFLLIVVLAAAGGAGWYWATLWRFRETTDDAYVVGDIIEIAPKIGGAVVAVPVRDQQAVAAGDILVRIDPRDYEARLAVAEAELDRERATLALLDQQYARADSMIAGAEAATKMVEADSGRVSRELARNKALIEQKLIPAARYDTSLAERGRLTAEADRMAAALQAAEQDKAMIEAQRTGALASLRAATARATLARIELENTTIRAPMAGVIGNLGVRLGEIVRNGTLLMAVVPLDKVWVEANFKETQIAGLKVGQPVRLAVDAYPELALEGRIESLSPASGARFSLLPPENATGNFTKIVQRVPVRITLPDALRAQQILRPGLSVKVTVDLRDGPDSARFAAGAD